MMSEITEVNVNSMSFYLPQYKTKEQEKTNKWLYQRKRVAREPKKTPYQASAPSKIIIIIIIIIITIIIIIYSFLVRVLT